MKTQELRLNDRTELSFRLTPSGQNLPGKMFPGRKDFSGAPAKMQARCLHHEMVSGLLRGVTRIGPRLFTDRLLVLGGRDFPHQHGRWGSTTFFQRIGTIRVIEQSKASLMPFSG
jgi:hypothetical protein